MKIQYKKGESVFRFLAKIPQSWCYERCVICKESDIEFVYRAIIQNLKEKGLIPTNYPYICCGCWNMATVVGRFLCPVCGKELDFRFTLAIKDKDYLIHCKENKDHFYKAYSNSELDTLLNEKKYDPTEIIERFMKNENL